ncbi:MULTISPECIES: DUF6332 family protein [unclassified Streptomyces]|jgi:hypothetical protein|uniref:DUF6332 family protein n=1 Tax=unclassified Streptomyces TaxID=2593676 RepID=UPI0036A965EF
MTTRRRTQAERDAITVEIGYALFSAVLLAALVLAAIAGPAAVWELPRAVEKSLVAAGAVIGGVLGVLRVVHVLWHHGKHRERLSADGAGSRPGHDAEGGEAMS